MEIESTIVQFEGHSTFLKGHRIHEVADILESAAASKRSYKFHFFEVEGRQNHVAIDARKVTALYRHIQVVKEDKANEEYIPEHLPAA